MHIITETVGEFHFSIALTDEQYELYNKLLKEQPELSKSETLDKVYEAYPEKKEEAS